MQQDRTSAGKFAAGNKLSRGNPHCDRIAKLRSAMLAAVTEKSMKSVIKKLIEMAEGGDVKAIQLLLDRTLGKIDAVFIAATQDDASTAQSRLSAAEFAQQYRAARMRHDAGLPVASSAQQIVDRMRAEQAGMTDEQIEAQRQTRLRASGLPPDATPSEILRNMMARRAVADQSELNCADPGRDDVTLDVSQRAVR